MSAAGIGGLPCWQLTAAVALAVAVAVAEAMVRVAWSYVVRGVSAIVCVAGIANIWRKQRA